MSWASSVTERHSKIGLEQSCWSRRRSGAALSPALPCAARSAARLSRPPSLQVLQKYFGAYRPGVMGMSMDESAHLLWRLMNGQIPRVNQVGGRALSVAQNRSNDCVRDETRFAVGVLRRGALGVLLCAVGAMPCAVLMIHAHCAPKRERSLTAAQDGCAQHWHQRPDQLCLERQKCNQEAGGDRLEHAGHCWPVSRAAGKASADLLKQLPTVPLAHCCPAAWRVRPAVVSPMQTAVSLPASSAAAEC